MRHESRSSGDNAAFRKSIDPIRPTAVFLASILLLSACGNRSGTGLSQTGPTDTLTIMWYNVENLFDNFLSGREYPDFVPDSMGWSYDVYLKSLDNISDVIAAANPDVVGLCEIENSTVLKDLIRMLRLKRRVFPHYEIGDTPLRSTTHPALLSRFPIRRVGTLPVTETDGVRTRNILECDILRAEGPLKIFVNHWPSKAHPEATRLAAARVLRRRLRELPSDCDYLILGDLNENYNESETIRTDSENYADGQTGLNHVLGTVLGSADDRNCPVTKNHIVSAAHDDRLYNLWWDLPEYRRWNYVYRRRRQTPDHILLPHALFDSCGMSYLEGSFSVFRWGGRLLFDGIPYRKQRRWHKGKRYHTGEGYSDHLPLMVKIVSGSYSGSTPSDSSPCEYLTDPTIGFESGYEGWIAGDMPFVSVLDSQTSYGGRRSLRITGFDDESRTIAKSRLIPGVMSVSGGSSIFMHLKGAGNLLIRFRVGSTRWRYVTPTNPTVVRRSGRYAPFRSQQWEKIQMNLPPGSDIDAPVEIEIRAKGTQTVDIWVDDVYRR